METNEGYPTMSGPKYQAMTADAFSHGMAVEQRARETTLWSYGGGAAQVRPARGVPSERVPSDPCPAGQAFSARTR